MVGSKPMKHSLKKEKQAAPLVDFNKAHEKMFAKQQTLSEYATKRGLSIVIIVLFYMM